MAGRTLYVVHGTLPGPWEASGYGRFNRCATPGAAVSPRGTAYTAGSSDMDEIDGENARALTNRHSPVTHSDFQHKPMHSMQHTRSVKNACERSHQQPSAANATAVTTRVCDASESAQALNACTSGTATLTQHKSMQYKPELLDAEHSPM